MDIPRQKPAHKRRPFVIAAGIVVVLLATAAISQMKPASPEVERATILLGKVERGPLLRSVHGTGSLVPEDQRFVSAVTAGRVEKVLARPGTRVDANTVLVELSNPDVQLEALDAERQLKLAEAELASVRANLETAKLAQDAALAGARTALREAKRAVAAAERLAKDGLNSSWDVERAHDQLAEARERYDSENRRTDVAGDAWAAQVALREADVERLRAIARFQRERVASMQVRAGAAGVVQELSLEPGMWVQSGARLARVASPEKLKAVIEIAETQARDLTLGLTATVDTRNGLVKAHVGRIDPGARNGTVSVDLLFDEPLPRGARPDAGVDGTIEIDKLDDVVFMGRPASGASESETRIFKLEPGGRTAVRVPVRLGRASFQAVEVLGGLVPGDEVILSDMSRFEHVDRVRLR